MIRMRTVDFPAAGGCGYAQRLIAANGLEGIGFAEFLFYPGMLFGRSEKWWGDGGRRAQSHEGLDLCFFSDAVGARYRLDDSVAVPAAFHGQVAAVMDDFLGQSVVLSHRDSGNGRAYYVFYAHIRPDRGVRRGDQLASGEIFAHIAPAAPGQILPAHLHLSIAWADSLPAVESLTWPVINRLDRNRFLDPIKILGIEYQIIAYNPDRAVEDAFIPVQNTKRAL